ncbi:Phospholipid-transporting ATPase ID [Trebouxia sp. C0009 RCD-2024]
MFVDRQVVVEVQGKQISFQILAVLEFNSDRKRMSVLCRLPDGRVRLYSKGADSMIYARLAPQQAVEQGSQPHLAEMAGEGLRTLCLGQRDIPDREYQIWSSSYHEATVALQGREEAVAAQAEAIETNLTLLGATAVEDRLQDGVPQAISTLSAAGIKEASEQRKSNMEDYDSVGVKSATNMMEFSGEELHAAKGLA